MSLPVLAIICVGLSLSGPAAGMAKAGLTLKAGFLSIPHQLAKTNETNHLTYVKGAGRRSLAQPCADRLRRARRDSLLVRAMRRNDDPQINSDRPCLRGFQFFGEHGLRCRGEEQGCSPCHELS